MNVLTNLLASRICSELQKKDFERPEKSVRLLALQKLVQLPFDFCHKCFNLNHCGYISPELAPENLRYPGLIVTGSAPRLV